MSKIVDEIRYEMYNKNISTKKLSDMSGVNLRTIQRILQTGDGKVSNVMAMCLVLGINLSLVDGDKNNTEPEKIADVPYERYAELQKKYDELKEVVINQAILINNLRSKI